MTKWRSVANITTLGYPNPVGVPITNLTSTRVRISKSPTLKISVGGLWSRGGADYAHVGAMLRRSR